ncbi:ChaN family lipoprotein [Agarivorans sp.]|uniref:ChaN family lipoprotein n=1 Tax=Agarivorans sp. TaxID=1872412 RepID=UPI003D01AA95
MLRRFFLLITSLLLSACSVSPSSTSNAEPTALSTYYDFQLYDPVHQQQINDISHLALQLADSQVILFGEFHTHPAIHLAQLRLFEALYQQNHQLSLSMEQFDRSQQPLLDQYLANKIGEEWLIKQSHAWDNYRSDYRPLVEFAKQQQLSIIAANAPNKHIRCLGQQGLDYLQQLPATERRLLAESLTLDDPAYQQRLFGNAHHGDEQQTQNHFIAMLGWDDTMAESITKQALTNSQQIMHTVGNFHIEQRQGTYSRVQQRLPQQKVSSVIAISEQEFAGLSAVEKQQKGDFLIIVRALPLRYQNQQHRSAEFAQIKQQAKTSCQ